MTTEAKSKNTKFIILGVIALILIGLFIGKLVLENRIKAWAREDLRLYEPMLVLESADVGASYLGSSITYSNVVYSVRDLPGMTIRIGKMEQRGMDRDTLMGKPGEVSTIDKVVMENMTVHKEGLAQPLVEVGLYEVEDMAFNYRDTRAALLESMGTEDPAEILKALAPVFQNSDYKVGPSKMENFKINLKQMDLVDMRLGLVTSTGLRELNKETEGFDAILDEAVYKDFFVDGSIEGTNFNTSLDSLVLKGFKYNYKALFEALGNIESQPDPTALVPALVQTGYNYEFSEIRAENFNFALPDMKANFKMASLAFGPRTVREQGPNVASKMSMTFNGMEVFTLDAIGLDKMILSDVMVDFIQKPEAYMKDMNFLMQVMEDPFMLFKGMRMENLYVKNLNAQGMASLANWQADVAMDDTVHIQSKLQSLYLSPMALRQMGMLMYGTGGYGQDILGMLAMRPDGVTADSNFKLDINIAKSSINFDTDFDLTLRQMGSLLFKMAGVTGEPDYYETYGDPLVSNLEISLKDSGILESLYSYMSSQGGASSPAAAKAALLDEVDSQLANADAMEARVLQGLRIFLDQGGRLSIMMQPNRPMPMSDEVFFQMPEAYNLEIRHTPN